MTGEERWWNSLCPTRSWTFCRVFGSKGRRRYASFGTCWPIAPAGPCVDLHVAGAVESKGLVRREKATTGKPSSITPRYRGKGEAATRPRPASTGSSAATAPTMASLFEGRRPSREEIGQLESLLEELKAMRR